MATNRTISIMDDIHVSSVRSVKSPQGAYCRGSYCDSSSLNLLNKGTKVLVLICKDTQFFLCLSCALKLANEIKETVENYVSAHELACILSKNKQDNEP